MRRSIVGAALIVGSATLTSCGDANPSASSREPATQNQWTTAGIVAESMDAALFLTPNGEGSVSFAAMDVDGVAVGTASIDKDSKLVAAIQNPSGDWLALVSECIEDSGNPCADATLFRVRSKLEKIEAIDLGASVQSDSIRPIAGLRSGDFVLQSTTNEQVQIGTVPAGASDVEWIWESPEFDLEAIRQRANETQNFDANAGPRIDICAADAGFFWRFTVSTGAPIGMASDGAVSAPKSVSVPTIDEALSFTCDEDKLVSYSYGSAGASVERKSWPLVHGVFTTAKPSLSTLPSSEGTVASVSERPGGGVVVIEQPAVNTAASSDPSVPQETTVLFADAEASDLSVLANSDSSQRPIVTDAGILIGNHIGDVVATAK